MKLKILSGIVLLISFSAALFGQEANGLNINKHEKKFGYSFVNDKLFKDTNITKTGKNAVQKVKIGGLFLSPTAGASFPEGSYSQLSKSGFLYGVKVELAYNKLYPFVFGFVYEHQKNPGNPNFMNANFLTQFDTKIISLGGSLDIILNKYIRSNFTIPIFTVEIKYATATRQVSPVQPEPIPGVTYNQSLLTYTAGLGFTIYVLDIIGKYTFAKDFSSLILQARIHIPVIKF